MKKMRNTISILLLTLVVIIALGSVGGTLAYLIATDGPVENIFNPSFVTSRVDESFNGTTKTNVRIQNTGNIDAFIRAALVFTWQDEAGNTLPYAVEAGDYTISLNIGEGEEQWTENGGYYYYNSKVDADGGFTGYLVTSCSQAKTYDDDRRLCVEIIGSAIQAEGIATSAIAAFNAVQQ